MTGCSQTNDARSSLAPVYQQQIDRVLKNPPSEFVKHVLSDYRVTDSEYREARQRDKDCVNNSGPGLDVQLPASGGIDVGRAAEFNAKYPSDAAAQAALDSIIDSCAKSTVNDIELVYLGVRDNPWGYRNYPEAVRACFSAAKVSDGKDLSDEDFAALVTDNGYRPSSENAKKCVADPFSELKELGK